MCFGLLLAAVSGAAAADLTATVTDQDANALVGAKVYLYALGSEPGQLNYTGSYGYSDETGVVSFGPSDQFESGQYQFKCRYLNLEYWSESFAMPDTTQSSIVIQSAWVTVNVYYAGQTAPQSKVHLYSGTGSCFSVYQYTDELGQALFNLPVGGTFLFKAYLFGNYHESAPMTVAADGLNMVTIDAGGGQMHISVQKDTAEPLSGRTVKLFSPEGCYLGASGTTDDNGDVNLTAAAGVYKIRVEHLGYQFWQENIDLQADTDVTVAIPHQDVTISVAGAFQTTLTPLPDTKVRVFTAQGGWMTLYDYTDETGRVTFSLPERAYIVKAYHLGQEYASNAFTAADAEVVIAMGQAEVAVDWNGVPLTDINVYVYTGTDGWTGINSPTNAAGKALFTLPEGTWKFRADYQGNQYWTAGETLVADTVAAVALPTGGGTLTLTIGKDDSLPLEGLNCYVYTDSGGCTGVRGATNSAGQVAFDLAEGKYTVRVDYLGHQFWSQIYDITMAVDDALNIPHQDTAITVNGLFGSPLPLENAKVRLYTGDEHYTPLYGYTDAGGQVVFSIPERDYKVRVDYIGSETWSDTFVWQPVTVDVPLADVLVSVTGAGLALENAKVKVYSDDDSYLGQYGYTDINGQITFRLPPDALKVKIEYLGHSFWSDVITPQAGQVNDLDVPIGGGNVTFTVLKDAQTPIANAKCYLYDSQGLHCLGMWGYTDDNGQVKFDLVDGAYTVKTAYLGYDYFSDPFTVPAQLNHSMTIDHGDVQITVNGVLDGAAPIEGARVELRTGDNGWLGLKAYSDANGQVLFSLPARDYRVKVTYRGATVLSDIFNNTDTTVEIPMATGTVTVTGAGQQFEGVKVYAYTAAQGWLGVYGYTDEQGAIAFVLPAGDYQFAACYQSKKFWSDITALSAGTTTGTDIDTGGGIFTLHLQKDALQGIADTRVYVYTDGDSSIGMYGNTDAQGDIAFALSDGGYKFKIYYLGNTYWSDAVTVPQQLASTMTLAHQRYDIFAQGINPGPQPLEHIKFYIYTTADKYAGPGGYTDSSGKISFDLADGQYKAKYYYNGQVYWTGTLQPTGTLVTINTGTTEVLPPVQDLSATVNAADQIELAWTAPSETNGLTIGGFHVYRRHICESDFERITATPLDATATGFADAGVSPSGTYAYYVTMVDAAGTEGHGSTMITAGFGGSIADSNTDGISDLTAVWDQTTATLSWTAVAGCAYQIYRGTAPDSMTPYQRSADALFTDPGATPNQHWYYQVATIKTLCDPQSGQPVDQIGPLSALVTLAPIQTAGGVVTPDLQIAADGDYMITSGVGQGHTLEGSYSGFDGPVTVTAVLGDQTVTGTAVDGRFTIDLPSAGDWQITIGEADGWPSTTFNTDWTIDDQPPSLTVDGADTRSTTESTVTITGLAADGQSALEGVTITSDRYADMIFGTTMGDAGNFTGQVPLKTGQNQLTITAADIHGNTTAQTIVVTQTLTALPVIEITSPADGTRVLTPRVTVSGTLRSTLPPEQIRLVLGNRVDFPTGDNGNYSFTFADVALTEGSNLITVRAETAYGNVSAQTTVRYSRETQDDTVSLPQIEVFTPLPGAFLSANPTVTGMVRSAPGVQSITVNGTAAECVGLGTDYASFQAGLSFAAGDEQLGIHITAEDMAGRTNTLTYAVYLDATPPVITLDGNMSAPPAVNTTTQSPYIVSGTITEANMAGVSVNDQPIALTPADQSGTYRFNAGLPLTFGQDQHIVLAAWDLSGNRTSTEWIVTLDSNLQIEVIAPRDGAELEGRADNTQVNVTVRIPGAQPDDLFLAAVDGGTVQTMARSGAVGNAAFSVPTAQSEHTLTVSVQNSSGSVLSSTSTGFSIRNMADVPLTVEDQKPANGATGVEPNDFIAFYFNKTIDPALLDIEVRETAHGKTYASLQSGADITQLSKVELVEVHRDREIVPGGIGHFPANRMVAFYPKRDLAYGATIYITATYDGEEIVRSTYNVRPLPTFIEGTVEDTLKTGIAGIEVAIPELGLTTTTDMDGGYGFGFKLPAGRNIPGGRFKVVANPGMKEMTFGIIEQWVTVTEGRLNSAAVTTLPAINPNLPFRRVISGNAQTLLANGALKLDLSEATLTFNDLRNQGDVHVQLLQYSDIPHKALSSFTPHWVFAVQPAGIKVSGRIGVQIGIPTQNGTYSYVQSRGRYYVLLGLDPRSLMMVPVGVAEFDYEDKMMKSLWPVEMERFDYFAFALSPGDVYPYIEQCALGEITLEQMIAQAADLQ